MRSSMAWRAKATCGRAVRYRLSWARMKPRFLNIYGLTPVPRPNVTDVVHPRDVDGEPPAVLRLRVPIDQTLKDAGFNDVTQLFSDFAADRAQLTAAREKRRQPARDEKMVISLNGLAIEALAESGQPLGQPNSWTGRR